MSLRLVPVFVIAAALGLSVKVGDLWHDLDDVFQPGAGVALAAEGGSPFEPAHPGEIETAEQLDPAPLGAPGERVGEEAQAEKPRAPQAAGGQFERWTITPRQVDDLTTAGSDSADNAANPGPASTEAPANADLEPTARPERLVASLPDPYELTDEEISLLQQLSARREQIEQRRRVVEQREALLAAAEARVEKKVAELEELRRTIEELVIQHDDQEEAQLRSLVKIYENMKPKEAARIFEQLDMVVLLEVIDRMKERKAAPVLARMSPDRAQEITLELAQRRNLPIAKE